MTPNLSQKFLSIQQGT